MSLHNSIPDSEYTSNVDIPVKILLFPAIKSREIEKKKDYIYSRLKNDEFEPGMISELQNYLEKELANKEHEKEMQILLEEVYLKLYSESSESIMFRNLMLVVSQIDKKLIYPTGPVMAIAATRHENREIRENGLRCFENWADKKYLSLLKNLRFEEKWLQNYCDLIIRDLEEGD